MEIKKFIHTAFAKQSMFSCRASPLISMEIKENSIMQQLQNKTSSRAGQGHKIPMAIMDRGCSGAIFFRVKEGPEGRLFILLTKQNQKIGK
jgi:hypothetical protein